jgi:parallel beta-helix repeat protein
MLSFIGNNVIANTFYVKPNGNNGADGKSHATAWKTIAKVNSYIFQEEDDVYFLAGGSWNLEKLVIDWNGTNSNRTIIGAYYMNNGNVTLGVPAGTSKPRIIGAYTGKCAGAPGSCIQTSSAVPQGAYAALIDISGNYVTLQNIRVQNSAGRGISVSNDYSFAILENNEVYYTAANSIIFNRGTSNNIMRNNDTSFCSVAWKNGDWGKIGNYWPTCNSAVGSSNNIFEGNYIHESYGEGIVMLRNAQHNIIRNNTLAAVRAVNIYLDNASNKIVENNILVGDRDGEFTYSNAADGHKYGGGIDVRVEGYIGASDAINNIIRNNLLVRTGGILMGVVENNNTQGKKVGAKFLNNTLVETKGYIRLHQETIYYGPTEIVNNIFYGSQFGNTACKISPAGIDVHHNHWNTAQSDAKCNGGGDIVANPNLNRTNWDTVGIANIPKAIDFKPKPGSSTIGAFSNQTDPVFTNEFIQASNLIGNCSLDLTEASQDYFCNLRSGQSDMGAIIVSSSLNAVSAPFYMNVGGGELTLSKTYAAEKYETGPGSYTNTKEVDIESTSDDAVYQSWRSNNGSLSWNIPIANGNYDLTLLYQEHYWGISEGNCTTAGSNRQFDVSVEGALVRNEFDICKLAGAPLTASRDMIPNITVADGQINIELSLAEGQDPKPQLMGLEIAVAAPVPSPPSNFIVR